MASVARTLEVVDNDEHVVHAEKRGARSMFFQFPYFPATRDSVEAHDHE